MNEAVEGSVGQRPGRLSGIGSILSRSSDIVLALLVVAIIALMILPLPAIVVDMLVAVNITIGVLLVLMGIYVGSAVQFSSFPSVLLISTLFRLALSVATTRMILLHGDAGHIIDTFGKLVAGGNLVVGLVVFLIITVVQFLVIAKGAERVAEVGARFTLDAMPGKQLSIDSDLRSGLLDKHEARAKRRELELESKLHGSMDGAMKFVKGDSIAGIIIILVNILGGLAIGIFQLGMPAGDAMAKYSVLTIGDGLVAQIPALLGAMAAGLIVTRSTDTESDRHLGDSIQKQFTAIPRVLLVAGGIALMMSLVPGFPGGVFVVIAVVLGISGALLVPALRRGMARVGPASFGRALEARSRRQEVLPTDAAAVTQSVPLLMWLPRELAGSSRDQELRTAVTDTVERFQERSGVALPPVRFRWLEGQEPRWSLEVFDVPVGGGEWSVKAGNARLLGDIDAALAANATQFLGIQESGRLLALASEDYPDIVKEAVRLIPIQNIAAIFRNLVEEGVPIRNLRAILEALVQGAPHEKDPAALTDFARLALARHTCHRLAPEGTLRVVALSAPLEERLTSALRGSDGAQQLVLDPATLKRVREAIGAGVGRHAPEAMLASPSLRRHVRQMLVSTHPSVAVLSYNELLPDLRLDVLEQVALDDTETGTPTR